MSLCLYSTSTFHMILKDVISVCVILQIQQVWRMYLPSFPDGWLNTSLGKGRNKIWIQGKYLDLGEYKT